MVESSSMPREFSGSSRLEPRAAPDHLRLVDGKQALMVDKFWPCYGAGWSTRRRDQWEQKGVAGWISCREQRRRFPMCVADGGTCWSYFFRQKAVCWGRHKQTMESISGRRCWPSILGREQCRGCWPTISFEVGRKQLLDVLVTSESNVERFPKIRSLWTNRICWELNYVFFWNWLRDLPDYVFYGTDSNSIPNNLMHVLILHFF